ncbi:MAG: precorrin-4 C(11)-methyltransferase [Bacteroidales bacterium]|nr:precorrin-4 C(11)-methyltransferase [Bacteroidales bacterium]
MERLLIVGKGDIIDVIKREYPENMHIGYSDFTSEHFCSYRKILFVGALGICVRSIAPYIKDKHTDPAVVCADSKGVNVISVLSGHIGGANLLAKEIAAVVGGEAVITTQSDNAGMWALDTLGAKFGWETYTNTPGLNGPIATYVNGGRVALVLDVRCRGAQWLEKSRSSNVDVFYSFNDIPKHRYGAEGFDYDLIIAVTHCLYTSDIPMVTYVPKVLHLGMGCKRGVVAEDVCSQLREELMERGYNPAAIASVSTVDIKKDEPLLHSVAREFLGVNSSLEVYPAEDLKDIPVPNPSEKALAAAGTPSVAEASALKSSGRGKLLVDKQKRENFTFAVALDCTAVRGGHIEIVGAGPGDPELVSVRGKRMLEEADLILYAGSLVPKELTYYAKEGAVVRSSASMDLEEQFAVMKEFYDKGLFVVRLHTGDPCIYGAIQEQMAYFDKYNMSYHITPGISSFLAAAAELQSQFTIPEKVQTIILTRGEGRTAMPEREKLHMLAQHRSTMCIFLSATVVDQVQEELLMHYPPQTPVAACYKLTWKDQKIFRGELKDLAKIVKDNNLTLTTMIVVGDSIGNRQGLSRLYAHEFKHIFRH